MPGPVAYNPNDPEQAAFLGSLALGESGGGANSAFLGFGGTDLSSAPRDQYGFPQWGGDSTSAGPTHAAGTYQFQPGTWEGVAQKYGLNFANPEDQNAGAWYLAQEVYQHNTGGSLDDALDHGDYQSVQNALRSTWTSVGGNSTAPQGLAGSLTSGLGAKVFGGLTGLLGLGGSGSSGSGGGGIISSIENWFVRGGLIIVGAIVALIALYMLLSSNDVVPSPRDIVKAVK